MRYHVLACDYDGTIAHHGAVDADTVDALAAVRKSGRRLVLVTGRELDDLARVFPDLDLFDRVVAENGALLYDPANRSEMPLGDAPDESLVRILGERGVTPLSAGKVIIATWTPHEHTVLETIRELGLELQVIFNKGAVMVLPSGINKASGLAAALDDLKLSPHNAVAIGDAENDHALLKLCECGVAVANALPAVKEVADHVTDGDHGRGVRELCELLVREDLRPLAPLTRRGIPIGTRGEDTEVLLPAYGGAVMVAGTSGGGKSTFTAAVLEHLVGAGYQVCILDPEGDYEHFEPAVVLGTSDNSPTVDEVLDVLDKPAQSVVVNILARDVKDRPVFAGELFPALLRLRAATGRPHWIVVDEAHHLFPREWQAADSFVPESLAGYLLITVHPDHVAPSVLGTVESLVAIGADPQATIKGFCDELGLSGHPQFDGGDLEHGEAILWQIANEHPPVRFRTRPPSQQLRRHLRKYAEGKLGEDRSFYFRGPHDKVRLRAYNLASFMDLGDGLDEETWLFHLRRHDYSEWMRTCIKDSDLADELRDIEAAPEVGAEDSRARFREAIGKRYTLPA